MSGAGAGTVPANVVPVTVRLFRLAAHTPLYFLRGGMPGSAWATLLMSKWTKLCVTCLMSSVELLLDTPQA